jgi:uncharacterized Zn finger protein
MLARCDTTGGEFSVGPVEVIQRYTDCSVFRCPECGGSHDDRMAWSGPREKRMGYTVITGASETNSDEWTDEHGRRRVVPWT